MHGRYERLNSDALNADKTVNALGAEFDHQPEIPLTDPKTRQVRSARIWGDQRRGNVGLPVG
jgi:hypothetical protein